MTILLKREFRNIYHKASEIFNILMFFVIICFIVSFGIKGDVTLPVAASIIIVCFMLASNLSSYFIFEKEIESGMLQQLYINLKGINGLIIAKILSQFICFALPLVLTIPLVALFFNINFSDISVLMVLVAFTSFIISVMNVMMAGITGGLKGGVIISVVLSVPLYIPLIVLDISFLEARLSAEDMGIINYILNISGFALVIIPLAIFAVRQSIRNAVDH